MCIHEIRKHILVFQASMDLPPDKAKLLKNYDNEKKWDIICDQVILQLIFISAGVRSAGKFVLAAELHQRFQENIDFHLRHRRFQLNMCHHVNLCVHDLTSQQEEVGRASGRVKCRCVYVEI